MADREYVEEEFSKAREALDDAEALRASGGSDAGVVNQPLPDRARTFVADIGALLDIEITD